MNDSSRRRNKIWVDKGNEVYKGLMKLNLKDNGIKMDSTHNEGKLLLLKDLLEPLRTKSINI